MASSADVTACTLPTGKPSTKSKAPFMLGFVTVGRLSGLNVLQNAQTGQWIRRFRSFR